MLPSQHLLWNFPPWTPCRTNSSYERWQQALAAWGAITTRGRDTMRQLLCYTAAAPEAGPASTKLLTVAATGR